MQASVRVVLLQRILRTEASIGRFIVPGTGIGFISGIALRRIAERDRRARRRAAELSQGSIAVDQEQENDDDI